MPVRSSIGAVVLATVIVTTIAAARAHDETKYPDWSGQWLRTGGIQWDPTKPIGRGQQAPLTPEYQAIFEGSLADQALGGAGNDPRYLLASWHAAADERHLPDGIHLHPED